MNLVNIDRIEVLLAKIFRYRYYTGTLKQQISLSVSRHVNDLNCRVAMILVDNTSKKIIQVYTLKLLKYIQFDDMKCFKILFKSGQLRIIQINILIFYYVFKTSGSD